MKRLLCCFLAILIGICALSSCEDGGKEGDGIEVICTSFSWYDWARVIVGESDGVTLRLLADGGKDMHSYSPSATDMMAILGCDLLIYGGGVSEAWVEDLAKEGKLRGPLSLMKMLGENVQYLGEHTHEDGHAHGANEIDEHVWLSLSNAMRFCEGITDALCAIDAENAATYRENCAAYTAKLSELDGKFSAMVAASALDGVVLADRHPFRYLFADYGITCHAAFEGCSTESDAGVSTVLSLVEAVNSLSTDAVLVTETSDGRLARTVVESSNAKAAEILTLHSLQSVPDAASESYLSVMEENLAVLAKALD